MNHQELELDIVQRFGVTNTEARKMIEQAEARAALKRQVAAASRGHVVDAAKAGEVDFEQPQQWRHEVHKRLAAIEVMEEGVACMRSLQKHIKSIIEAEEQLIQKKQAKVRDKQTDWWDLRDSGWAMGGRERFATYVGDIFRNLDEGKLGGKVMDHMGFKRSIPLPDIPEPVIETEVMDAEQLEASLVRGAKGTKRTQVKGAKRWFETRTHDQLVEEVEKWWTKGSGRKYKDSIAKNQKLSTPDINRFNARDWEILINYYVITMLGDSYGWERSRNI